ncbi:MAG: hypothetical protein HY727_15160 [Candidatus Rokubacteria bacterium]|nr:hypothetical protein [Candidatus Rokubacteria bacterium]
MALNKHFYVRFVYNAITIDFEPATKIEIQEVPIRGQNVGLSGVLETVYERNEVLVTLTLQHLTAAIATSLMTYWRDWGSRGFQGVLTLDRLGTCGGQWEYDNFNSYFSKAELVIEKSAIARSAGLSVALYLAVLTFRQGV